MQHVVWSWCNNQRCTFVEISCPRNSERFLIHHFVASSERYIWRITKDLTNLIFCKIMCRYYELLSAYHDCASSLYLTLRMYHVHTLAIFNFCFSMKHAKYITEAFISQHKLYALIQNMVNQFACNRNRDCPLSVHRCTFELKLSNISNISIFCDEIK